MSEQKNPIVATQSDLYNDCWIYRLADGSIIKGVSGAARIPCGLCFNERNQWGANQIFSPKPYKE